MSKPIILENPIIVDVKKLFPYSKSSAITIPKGVKTFLNLKNGDRLVISVDLKSEKIILSKPEDMEDKKTGGSYELGIPKKLYEKLLKE